MSNHEVVTAGKVGDDPVEQEFRRLVSLWTSSQRTDAMTKVWLE